MPVSLACFDTDLVPSPLEYAVLIPDGASGPLPLVYLLHGGNGDRGHLAQMQPVIERAWQQDLLPPAVIVTPSAGRSFYMDYRDGSQRWESLLAGPLLAHLRKTLPVAAERESTCVVGISMGGMGGLRLAFKHPERFCCVAALEPGIEPAQRYDAIELRDRFWRAQPLFEEKYGRPVDEAYWQASNPASIAAADPGRLRDSGLWIYLEAGDRDAFGLDRGTEFLHRVLYDAGVSHEYRLVRGADHVGTTVPGRFLDAFAFVGRALRPPSDDPALVRFHEMIGAMKRAAGLGDA